METRSVAGEGPGCDPSGGLPTACRDKGGRLFVVRPYREADRPELEAFYTEFEPKRTAQGLPPSGTERVVRWLNSVLPSGIHLVVEMEGALMGHALLGHALLVPTGQPGTAEYAIFLHQDVRGRGVGTQVNRIAVDVARAAGYRRLWLSVEPHNRPAIRTYEKAGFRFLPGTVFSLEAEMELDL